jgi:hypothetical protein
MKTYTIKFGVLEKWYSINEVEVEANSKEEAENIFLENYGEYYRDAVVIENEYGDMLDEDPDILSIE